MSFTLAIVGRPNVGKSTLFNRLVGRKLALVDDQPGVTRDLREGEARLGNLRFNILDTAGLEDATDDSLQGRMRKLSERAVEMADASLFLIDARAGVTANDRLFRRDPAPLGPPGDPRRQQGGGHGRRGGPDRGVGTGTGRAHGAVGRTWGRDGRTCRAPDADDRGRRGRAPTRPRPMSMSRTATPTPPARSPRPARCASRSWAAPTRANPP
jgi:hypothetical protein